MSNVVRVNRLPLFEARVHNLELAFLNVLKVIANKQDKETLQLIHEVMEPYFRASKGLGAFNKTYDTYIRKEDL